MAVARCARGHYFDNEKFKVCPHCTSHKANVPELYSEMQADTYAAEYIRKNRAGAPQEEDADMEKTIGIYQSRTSSRYAAGWLVCIKGEEYGCSYPLYAGFNRIGKSRECDITLTDPLVSKQEHCSVVYEEKKNIFFVLPKDGCFVYVDEMIIGGAQELKNGQVVTVGETELEMVVFCAENKRWIKK